MFQAMKYFDVYVLCQAANRLLQGGFERNINDFFEPLIEPENELIPFSKYSLLHNYCEWVVQQNAWNEEDEENTIPLIRKVLMRPYLYNRSPLWIDSAIKHYCKVDSSFRDWINDASTKTIEQMTDAEISDHRYNYLCNLQLSEEYESCVTQLSNEMFYILFQNREFLYNFNGYLATYNQNQQCRALIPEWAKRAVFFRDRGCCVFCGKDLSGTIHITENREIHYDHIIPLANDGMNDVSNLQLSCRECNLKKRDNSLTSTKYQQWYEMDDK